MRLLLFAGFLVISSAAYAGNTVVIINNSGYPYTYWPQPVEAFDDSVFNLKTPPEPDRSGSGRPYAPPKARAERATPKKRSK